MGPQDFAQVRNAVEQVDADASIEACGFEQPQVFVSVFCIGQLALEWQQLGVYCFYVLSQIRRDGLYDSGELGELLLTLAVVLAVQPETQGQNLAHLFLLTKVLNVGKELVLVGEGVVVFDVIDCLGEVELVPLEALRCGFPLEVPLVWGFFAAALEEQSADEARVVAGHDAEFEGAFVGVQGGLREDGVLFVCVLAKRLQPALFRLGLRQFVDEGPRRKPLDVFDVRNFTRQQSVIFFFLRRRPLVVIESGGGRRHGF